MNGIEATIEILKGPRELQPTHIVALTANALQENKYETDIFIVVIFS